MLAVPLCVDLDGTLIRTDLLVESALTMLRRDPSRTLWLPVWLLGGRAKLKQELARRADVSAAELPYHEEFLAFLREQKASGRRLVLTTASDARYAHAVAAHTGLFDEVLASDGSVNLKGSEKLSALRRRFPGGFDYAGNERADLPVWAGARRAVVVDGDAALVREIRASEGVERVFSPRSPRAAALVRTLRPHQWAKNLLLLVPAITSHRITHPETWGALLAAMTAFSLCASSVYVVNDLLDLASDRSHATKKTRPFPSGDLPLSWGPALAAVLLSASAAVAAFLPPRFQLVLAAYLAITFAYSLRLKQVVLLDVFCLASLYTLRLLAGHGATGIPLSPWLLAFSMFIFISLAQLKRYTEVARLPSGRRTAGRDYHASDAHVLMIMGVASGYMSVLVFALYINSPQVLNLYTHASLLWILGMIILYVISRLWLLASRGEVDDDPVLFSLRDRVSYLAVAAMGVILVLASR